MKKWNDKTVKIIQSNKIIRVGENYNPHISYLYAWKNRKKELKMYES